MTFQDFVKLLRQRWWIILTTVIASTVSAFIFSAYYTVPLYANTSTLLVNERNNNEKYPLTFDDVLLYEKLLGTYKQIILSNRVLKPVAAQMNTKHHLSLTASDLPSITSVSSVSNSQIITITVKHSDYLIATDIANAIAQSFSNNLQSIMNVDNVSIVDPAELLAHPTPISPNIKLNILIGFVLGLGSCMGIILLLHLIDTRIRSEEDLFSVSESLILGTIPKYNRKKKEAFLLTKFDSTSMISEAYRTIRTSLTYLYFQDGQKVILFTSPVSGEGKTTIISNLGILTALDGKKVLIIDGDLRRPHLHHIFRASNRIGLSSVLSGSNQLGQAILPTDTANLFILPAGPIQPNPAELLGNSRMVQLVKECREEFDVILIDTPAVTSVSDATILSRIADGIILSVRFMYTKKEQLRKAHQILEPSKNKVLGLIINDKADQETQQMM